MRLEGLGVRLSIFTCRLWKWLRIEAKSEKGGFSVSKFVVERVEESIRKVKP